MAHTFHHLRGGDSTYRHALCRQLESAGHTVVPLAMRHPHNDPSTWEHRFLPWVDMREPRSLAGSLRLGPRLIWSREARDLCRQLIDETQPDIAHIQHIHRHITPSILEPLNRANIPVVWTVHDYELICPEGHLFAPDGPCTRCRGHRYREAIRQRCKWEKRLPSAAAALEKHIHRLRGVWDRVDRFLCPSAFLADRLVDFGISADKVIVIPNFIECSPSLEEWETGRGVLYAGRLTAEKGVDILIEAARALPEHPLWICGTGPDQESLERRASGLDQVHFLGHLPRKQLETRLQGASVVCVPSRWYENFPFAVLEAQARGRPVIASRIGGIPEQIDDGVDGLLVPPNDPQALTGAISSLLSNPDEARRLGTAGAARVRERLNADTHMAQLMTIYSELMG